MNRSTRLTLICRGATEANRRSIFGLDQPLTGEEAAKASHLRDVLPAYDRLLSAPEKSACSTARCLATAFDIDPVFADLDYGDWTGKSLTEIAAIDPTGLQAWLGDVRAAPHRGESLTALNARCAAWMTAQLGRGGHLVAVTHSAVIRMMIVEALAAPAASFWRVDIAPLTVTELRNDARRWTVHRMGADPA